MVVDNCSSLLALVLSSNILKEERTAALDSFPMDPFSFQEEEEVLAADSSTCSNPYPLESDEPGTLGIHPLEALNQCVESMSSTVQSETKMTRLGVGRTRNSSRTGPRRHKANARERQRMHGLNDALDLLRRRAPIISGTQKLSKIETLRLARNYIELLDRVLTDKQPELLNNSSSNAETSNLLTRGLSQTTSNVIESLLGVHPRSCFNFPPQQANKSYNNEGTTHSGGLQPRSRLQGGDFQLNDLLSNLVSHNRVQSAPSDSESLHLLSEQDQPHTSNSVDGENNIWNIEDEWDSELIQFDEHSICF